MNNCKFYPKSMYKHFKFSNFDKPSPNFSAPSIPIPLSLINYKFQIHFYKDDINLSISI